MRRTCFYLCLALSFACAVDRRAHASPLMLSITGYAYNVPVNYVTDVSNGFSGATISLTTVPAWGTGPGSQGGVIGINSSIDLTATLYNSTQNLASMALTGQITGGIDYPSVTSLYPVTGGVSGSATPGPVYLNYGVDSSVIPAWFPTLGAGVSDSVTGGTQAYLPITLGIGTGDTPAAPVQPAPVPEPASVAIFLPCAVAGFYMRTARRKA